ncbi:uncharacterized protein LOC136041549 isoform X1 [Artemia franciscana]|uniref:uncharacterized protein LOC136041549 isoform X1 n=1 Tax=Artemia franciscana TaxID=6661 RepID=UPI0032DAABAF
MLVDWLLSELDELNYQRHSLVQLEVRQLIINFYTMLLHAGAIRPVEDGNINGVDMDFEAATEILKIKHQWYSHPIRWCKEEHHQGIVSSRWCSLRHAQCMHSPYLVLFHLTLQINFLMSRCPLLGQLVISHPSSTQ